MIDLDTKWGMKAYERVLYKKQDKIQFAFNDPKSFGNASFNGDVFYKILHLLESSDNEKIIPIIDKFITSSTEEAWSIYKPILHKNIILPPLSEYMKRDSMGIVYDTLIIVYKEGYEIVNGEGELDLSELQSLDMKFPLFITCEQYSDVFICDGLFDLHTINDDKKFDRLKEVLHTVDLPKLFIAE